MARTFLLIVGVFFSIQLFAQTGIGTSSPNASAKLDVFSDNKGFLPPRVTLTTATDNTTISNPAEGLLVYNKGTVGLQAGYYYWNGANWATIATATSAGNGVTASDMVKIYDGVGNAATINSSGATFSVTTSGKYLFDFSTSAACNSCNVTLNFQVRDGANSNAVIASDMQTSHSNNVHAEYNGKVEANLIGGRSYNVLVTASSGGIYNNDYSRVYMKQVSGNLPVTGQSVEYGIARYTGADGASLSANAIVAFDATAAGNLAWSGNKFTLKANKTYELESYLAVYHASAGVAGVFQIYNYTNSAILANGLYLSINGTGGYNVNANGPMRCIVTPTTDIEVGVRITTSYGGWPSIVGSTNTIGVNGAANQSYLLVKQIGSSAIINPWTLSGTNTYNTTGNVGIGNTSPSTSLHIENGNIFGTDPSNTTSPSLYVLNTNNTSTSAHATALIRSAGSGGGNPYLSFDIMGVRGYSMGIDNADSDKFKFHTNWNLNNSNTPALTITTEARIGIGTTTPSAPLHVASNVVQYVNSYGYLNTGGASTYTLNGNTAYSIQSDARIRASEFNAISDFRIKKDILKLNSSKQLTELNKLNVVNYRYIDNLLNGNRNKTGFIAQEVESVKPQFVNRSSDFIPSFFDVAKSVNINNELLQVSTTKPHGFAKGDLVKFFAEGKKEIVKTIEEVTSSNNFSVKDWRESTNNLFIYGKKVNDFRAIDFDQITALSVGAIQELSKKVDKLEVENEKLKKLIKDIEVKISKMSAEIRK